MKNKAVWLGFCLFLNGINLYAQDKFPLKINDAIRLAVNQSKQAKATETKVLNKTYAVDVAKNKALPDVKLTGQVAYLSTPTIDLKIPMGNSGEGASNIETNRMYLGMLNVNMPVYAGGKINSGIQLSKMALQNEKYSAMIQKDQIANQTIALYVALYKAQQTVVLMDENIKRASQQVVDFKAMEQNGLIARNDLLKAELQLSNYQIHHQEAVKNCSVLNYQLVTLLELDPATKIADIQFEDTVYETSNLDENYASTHRNEIKMIENQRLMGLEQVKITKADYFPTVAVTAGYNALGLKDVVTVNNAMTIGLGLSYDLGSFYKNGKSVKQHKTDVKEAEEQLEILNDRIKIEVYQAQQDFDLSKNQKTVFDQALKQSEENYRIVKNKYDNGVADTDDLLEADVQKAQAQINVAVAQATIIEKYYNLLLVNGDLTSQFLN